MIYAANYRARLKMQTVRDVCTYNSAYHPIPADIAQLEIASRWATQVRFEERRNSRRFMSKLSNLLELDQ
jgi:hypothetical protein